MWVANYSENDYIICILLSKVLLFFSEKKYGIIAIFNCLFSIACRDHGITLQYVCSFSDSDCAGLFS